MNQIAMDLTAPRARRTDPATSKAAAEGAVRFYRGHKAVIINWLEGIHPRAATFMDISGGTGLNPWQVARRLKEIEADGRITRAGEGKLPDGNEATLWRAI